MERVSQRIEFLSSDTEVSMVNPSTDFTDFGTYRVLIIANQTYDNLINLSRQRATLLLLVPHLKVGSGLKSSICSMQIELKCSLR